MEDFGAWNEGIGQFSHEDPGRASVSGLAPSTKRTAPCFDDTIPELMDGHAVSGNGVIVQPPTNHRSQPGALFSNGQ
jgi:hypothetical protein